MDIDTTLVLDLYKYFTEIRATEIHGILSLTFQGHPRSKIMAANESWFTNSYMFVIQTKSLSLIVFGIFTKKL